MKVCYNLISSRDYHWRFSVTQTSEKSLTGFETLLLLNEINRISSNIVKLRFFKLPFFFSAESGPIQIFHSYIRRIQNWVKHLGWSFLPLTTLPNRSILMFDWVLNGSLVGLEGIIKVSFIVTSMQKSLYRMCWLFVVVVVVVVVFWKSTKLFFKIITKN